MTQLFHQLVKPIATVETVAGLKQKISADQGRIHCS
jgi:hypothetical protein